MIRAALGEAAAGCTVPEEVDRCILDRIAQAAGAGGTSDE